MSIRSLLGVAARLGRQQQSSQQRNFSAVAGAGIGAGIARRALILFPSAGLGVYAVVGDEPRRVAFTLSVLPVRLYRDVYTAFSILGDYKWSLRNLDGEALDAARSACHQRGADRLLKLCFANGGIYIKLGQHIAMLDHLLPSEYVTTMRNHMLDRCPVSSWDNVRAVVEEDLKAPLETIFSEFAHEPVASASLAQVHVAIDASTGKKVAVKVQHRGLRETSAVDLAAIEALVRTVKFLSPSADYMWLVNEANENLPLELDFLEEAKNSERCAKNLSSPLCRVRGRVVVPSIDHSKTSHRILTMEYIDGVKISDRKGLRALGCPRASLARLISKTFNEMVFTFGDVHADPHAANMLVRATPPGERGPRWQLVLLDHGLYRRLDDNFRLQYASLWRSLIFADVEGITASAKAMNAGHAVPLFAGMLTQRPWEEVSRQGQGTDRLVLKYTEEEQNKRQQLAGQYASEIGELLARIPRELLLLLKTNDCLRAVDMELDAGVNNYVITARECTRALAAQRAAEMRMGWGAHTAVSVIESLRLEARLSALRAMSLLAPLKAMLWGERGTRQEDGALVVEAVPA